MQLRLDDMLTETLGTKALALQRDASRMPVALRPASRTRLPCRISWHYYIMSSMYKWYMQSSAIKY
ncbi:hypothetical protein GN244_ATG11508 [Phytophthora infestans]|uniref:Uncharacterized protein n=1 Tax=Phytophthora infestans TaxID=4787 RepID=A0A833SNJ2_PHYIN|nr:hypothetical protein GN244_ATG11508 [Phytophthora infestans]